MLSLVDELIRGGLTNKYKINMLVKIINHETCLLLCPASGLSFVQAIFVNENKYDPAIPSPA